MKTLVLVEHDGKSIKDSTYATVTAASQLGEVHLLVVGRASMRSPRPPPRSPASARSMSPTPRTSSTSWPRTSPPIAVEQMGHHDALLAPASTYGKNIAPRVAALLDVMQFSEILSVEEDGAFTRPIYAGNAIATVKSKDAKKVITVRTTGFDNAARRGRLGHDRENRRRRVTRAARDFVGLEASKSERPELTSAKIIVSGGRALRLERAVPRAARSARRQARRRGRGFARRGRRGLCAQRLSGRADGQDRRPGSLCRDRHLGRDPAPRGDEGFEGHHRHQQGRGSADLPGRRHRPGRRPVQDRAGTD